MLTHGFCHCKNIDAKNVLRSCGQKYLLGGIFEIAYATSSWLIFFYKIPCQTMYITLFFNILKFGVHVYTKLYL